MKYLFSFVFFCTLAISAHAQTGLSNMISTNNGIVLSEDEASTELPDCLHNRVIKELEDETVIIDFRLTNPLGTRIYHYQLSNGEMGFFSIVDLNCDTIITFAVRIEDL